MLFNPYVALFGPDILVGRLTVVAASLLGCRLGWIGRRIGGPPAGLVCGAGARVQPGLHRKLAPGVRRAPSIAPTILGPSAVVFRRDGPDVVIG